MSSDVRSGVAPRPSEGGPYCLRCYGPLRPEESRCPHCAFVNLRTLHRRYWSREPVLVRGEWAVKGLIALGGLVLAGWIVRDLPAFGSAMGDLAILPALFVYALWGTASRLTQHPPFFSPRLFWMTTSAIVGVVGLSIHAIAPVIGLAGIATVHTCNLSDQKIPGTCISIATRLR